MARLCSILLAVCLFPLRSLAGETCPTDETGYFTRATALFSSGDLAAAHEAVREGLEFAPSSVRLRLVEIDILERQNRTFEMRNAIRAALEIAPLDQAVLRRWAHLSDLFGDHAGEAYERWAQSLQQSGASEQEVRQALERGLVVALRDNNSEAAKEMTHKLAQLGDSRFSTPPAAPVSAVVTVPGGVRALSGVAVINPLTTSSNFVGEYARTLLRSTHLGSDGRRAYLDLLKLYFQMVRELSRIGKPVESGAEILLGTDPLQRSDTDKALAVLGWQIRGTGPGLTVEVRSGVDAAMHQEIASLLVDQVEMKLRLEQRQPFVLRILEERVPTIIEESRLLEILPPDKGFPRSALEQMVYNPSAPSLYTALVGMKAETRQLLLRSIQPDQLPKSLAALSFYGPALNVERGRLVLPGGVQSADAWRNLVGVDPNNVELFISTLIRKDGGKQLAYFYTLATLPTFRQGFFTQTVTRLANFYNAFPFMDASSLGHGVFVRKDDPFVRLAREMPLDQAGTVKFPGGARVWMVAQGTSDNIDEVESLLRRARSIDAVAADDKILLEMLKRTNKRKVGREFSQVESFLAVARIESHRTTPMDETMALALAQNYGRYASLFPYFADLPELTSRQAVSLFRAAARLERFEGNQLNTAFGEFHSLLKLVVLLREVRATSFEQATESFGLICERFGRIQSDDELASVSFDLLETILESAGVRMEENADEALVRLFGGVTSLNEFLFEGSARSVNSGDVNAKRIREVLELQSIGSLDDLLRIYRAAHALPRDTAPFAQIDDNVARLTELGPMDQEKISGRFADQLSLGDIDEVVRISGKLKKALGAGKPSQKDVVSLAGSLIAELNPFLKTTLAGWIYAYYASPQDLAIASNRYLVRSHLFADKDGLNFWPETRSGPSEAGLRLIGGFAQMASAMGTIATARVESKETVPQTPVVQAQMAAVRSVPWSQVHERSTHLVSMKIKLGKEFVVGAAINPDLVPALEHATSGTIGIARRVELLDSLRGFDVQHALRLLSATDFFFLADAFVREPAARRFSESLISAYESELQHVSPDQANYFGGIHTASMGCVHPHLAPMGPYEDYADTFSPGPAAERLSGILLEIAESSDRLGLPSHAVALIAEDAVREFSRQTRTQLYEDWVTALEVMRSIEVGGLVHLLEGKQ